MKIFFWLLLALNVILFAVMKFGIFDSGAVVSIRVPLHAEKVKLMTSDPVQSAPLALAQSAPASVPVAVLADLSVPVAAPLSMSSPGGACYEWGVFSGAELAQVKTSLAKLSLVGHFSQREAATNFWVYIPPLSNKVAIKEKLLELKQRGITDYFVVQDAGEWRNAISLGLFKSRDAAQNYLKSLHDQGVNSAQSGERVDKNRAVVLVINGVDAKKAVRLSELQKEFAASELKVVKCH